VFSAGYLEKCCPPKASVSCSASRRTLCHSEPVKPRMRANTFGDHSFSSSRTSTLRELNAILYVLRDMVFSLGGFKIRLISTILRYVSSFNTAVHCVVHLRLPRILVIIRTSRHQVVFTGMPSQGGSTE